MWVTFEASVFDIYEATIAIQYLTPMLYEVEAYANTRR